MSIIIFTTEARFVSFFFGLYFFLVAIIIFPLRKEARKFQSIKNFLVCGGVFLVFWLFVFFKSPDFILLNEF